MNQANLFANLVALDQRLYQETTPTPKTNESEGSIDQQPEEKPAATSLLANQQTSKPAKKQTNKLANLQTSKEAKKQTSKLVSQQTSEASLSTNKRKNTELICEKTASNRFSLTPFEPKEKTTKFYKRLLIFILPIKVNSFASKLAKKQTRLLEN